MISRVEPWRNRLAYSRLAALRANNAMTRRMIIVSLGVALLTSLPSLALAQEGHYAIAPDAGAHVCAPEQVVRHKGELFCVILPPEG